MAKVGDQAHTDHGLGTITESMIERGRVSYRVAGRGFSVWIDETKLRVASEGGLFSMGPMREYAEQARNAPIYSEGIGPHDEGIEHFATSVQPWGAQDWEQAEGHDATDDYRGHPDSWSHQPTEQDYRDWDERHHQGGLESTIIPGEPYHVQDNSTTLPWNGSPQYPVDLWAKEQTILPGDSEIDAAERTHPSDSVSGQSRSKPSGPQPAPHLFAGGGGEHPFEHTAALHRYAFDGFVGDHQHHDPLYNQGPNIPGVSGLGDPANVPEWERGAFDAITAPGRGMANGMDWIQHHLPHHQSSAWDHTEGDHYGDYVHAHEGHDEDYSERDAGAHSREMPDGWSPLDHDYTVHMDPKEYESYGQHGGGEEDKYSGGRHETYVEGNLHRPAGLSDRYAFYEVEAARTPMAEFAADPTGFISRTAHVWIDGDESLERFAAYTDLIDADPQMREAAWADVRAKAQRLRHEGAIDVADAGPNRMYATVQGDNGVYDVMIYKAGNFGGNQSVLDWACSCDWGRWAFKRKFSYVGRLCSHAYATYLHMQSDHVKKHPIGKSAASVEDYKSYLKDNNQAPEAASVASYLNTQGNDATDADVAKLYDYVSDNPEQTPERDFKIPYGNDPETAYKTADLLRTKPQSLTPSLHEVPAGEGQQWMDLEKDERETTGPDQIVHFSHVLRQLHGGEGITDFGTTMPSSEPAVPAADPSVAGTGGDAVPDPSTSSAPDSSVSGTSGSTDSSEGSLGTLAALHRAADVLDQLRELPPASDSAGAMDARNDRVRDLVDKAQDQGYDATQFVAAQNPTLPADSDANFLGQSNPDWADQGFAGSGPDPKDWYSDSAGYVQENEQPHVEQNWFEHPDDDIIKYNDSRSKPQQGPRSARVGTDTSTSPSAPGSDDGGSWPGTPTIDSQYQSHDTPSGLGGYEYGLGGHFSALHQGDMSASDSGGQTSGDTIAPGMGLGGGEMASPDTSFGDVTAALHHAAAGDEDDEVWHGEQGSADTGNYTGGGSATYAAHDPAYHRDGYPRDDAEDELFPEFSAPNGIPVEQDRKGEAYPARNVHQAADAVDVGHFDPQAPDAFDWDQGSGDDFMNAVGDEASQVTDPMQNLPGGEGGGGGKGAAEGEGAGAAAGEGALAEMPMVIAQRQGGFDVSAFDRGEFSFEDAPRGGELRRAGRVGSGARQPVRIDAGTRDGRLPGQRVVQAQHAPEDFGFDGVDEARYAAIDDGSAADIVANFQRNGAAGLMSNAPQPGGSDDIASSPLVQSFLRTAGRVYPEDEQRRLEGEFHPQGARNMPTEDDLAGTHYLL